MKKVISVLLTACMLFLIPGCSSSESAVSSFSSSELTYSEVIDSSAENEVITSQADDQESSIIISESAENAQTSQSVEPAESATEPQETDEVTEPSEMITSSATTNPTTASITAAATKPAAPTISTTAKPTSTLPATTKPASTTATTKPAETTVSEPQQSEIPAAATLVVYFSCTGNTKAVAEKIADICGADIYEIVPADPYTSDDLNYNNDSCRANREMNDNNARPAIGSPAVDLSGYDTVFIGYPIWWGTCPRIINTFLDTYDLSGKTVMPFCTSGGSGVSTSVSTIRSDEPNADVRNGLRASGANDSGIESWISENNIQ